MIENLDAAAMVAVCTRPGCRHDRGSHWDGSGECGWCPCAAFTTEPAPWPPVAPQPAPVPGEPDPVAILAALGAVVSPDLGAYASGQLPADRVRCALCGHAPCDCPPFGTAAYFELLDRRHGRNRTGGAR